MFSPTTFSTAFARSVGPWLSHGVIHIAKPPKH